MKDLTFNLNIQFNTIVKAIHWNKKKIKIITNRQNYDADAVIITVPLGVLKNKKIEFIPTLSLEKQQAIERLDMGLFNIVGLKFKKVFWPEDCHAFSLPHSALCSMFVNTKNFTHRPILLGYFGGMKAKTLESLSDPTLINHTVSQLKYFFGKKVTHPENYFITRWFHDEFSVGSYSYLPVNASPNDRVILSTCEKNRLFFAGEATVTQSTATVHGAYLSGIREANKVKKLFSI